MKVREQVLKEIPETHSLQEIMSRLGSFPLSNALNLLRRHAPNAANVFDPFCGKGTSLFAGRLLGMSAYGMDTAPEAIACTKSKLVDASKKDVEILIRQLRDRAKIRREIPDKVKVFFHDDTLAQILSIYEDLREYEINGSAREKNSAVVLIAALLGILHGHASYSLSIPSAHAYAMSPCYVAKYALKHGLSPPNKNVKECLAAKIGKCLHETLPRTVKHKVVLGQAQRANKHFQRYRNKIDCVLTSPPYLSLHTYAKDNWLRQWLLGYDYKDLTGTYLQTGSVVKYQAEMAETLISVHSLLSPNANVILIVGNGRSPRAPGGAVELHRVLSETILQLSELYSSPKIETQAVKSSRRYLHSLKNTGGHNDSPRLEYVMTFKKR